MAVLLLFSANVFSQALPVLSEAPDTIDPNAKYLFYMHGVFVEIQGKDAYNPRYGHKYEYDNIVNALQKLGFVVISEVRPKGTKVPRYARKVSGQVKKLLDKGVRAENISVIGHSKGGMITLYTTTMISSSKVNFVIMAGCGLRGGQFRKGFARFSSRDADRISGHILSIYDKNDKITGTCREALDQAEGAAWGGKILETGEGHGLFSWPKKVWLDPVAQWAGKSN